jgi:hypothetical protein
MRCASPALFLLACGGCHYYQVRDARTGDVFYADKWIAADGYRGPLHFTDSTGRSVDLRASEVTRMPKDEWLEAKRLHDEQAADKPVP